MEWLFIFGLAGVAAYLWNRLDRAEKRLDTLDRLHEATLLRLRDLVASDQLVPGQTTPPPGAQETSEASAMPQRAAVTVPKTSLEPAVLRAGPSPQVPQEAPAEPVAGEIPDSAEGPRTSRFSAPKLSFDFEDIFGRKLPIWGGGVALAVAGVFLVRYAIDAGLLTPSVRVVMAFLFGIGLIGGAEVARRFEHKVADERVQQALAGAGLATLYAGFYLAGSQYGLIGQLVAFVGLAAVTAVAIALSFRFGLPSAVLGLVGGFAAPALVGGDGANVPLLALYLGLVTAGLAFSGERQNRSWLGIAALVGGLGWGAVLLAAGDFATSDVVALGLYFLVLGAVVPALIANERFGKILRLASAGVASIQLAILVDAGGYTPLAWGLYLLMGGALAFFGWRKPELREGCAIASTVGLLLLMQWPQPEGMAFTLVSIAMAALFAGVPLAHLALRSERKLDAVQLAAVPPALALVAYSQFGSFSDDLEATLACACLALAALPIAGAWLAHGRLQPRLFAGLTGSGAALVFAAFLMLTPAWSAPLVILPSLAAILSLAHRRADRTLANLGWTWAAVAVIALVATPDFFAEAGRLGGESGDTQAVRALLRWMAVVAPFAALAWLELRDPARRLAEGFAAAALYGALSQVLPVDALAWTAALLGIVLALLQPVRLAAQAVLAAIAGLWALPVVATWIEAGLASLANDPIFVIDLPGVKAIALQLLPTVAVLAFLRGRVAERRLRRAIDIAAGGLGILAAHVLFKQIFAIETLTGFVELGMTERTLWQAVLLGAAWIAASGLPRIGTQKPLAIGLAAVSLAHFMVYSWLIHNPLWDRQALGPLPLANIALAAYATGVGAALSLRAWVDGTLRPWIDGLVVALAAFGALTLLRQAFGGSIPFDEAVGPTEDLLQSLTGIVLAFAFLFVGARRQERSWRVGSLVVMLIAVAKVFVFDAAGLEGLLRIASFLALGFALIGIGWLYARQLRGPVAEAGPADSA
ncbi:DUF2339 domain-containing protein [Qipengyuania oceanensis]|uniref:DUF2339 domain-containing protein n=1 Tax=Qipengyuania oceanensis TaxID=1463597 RepID=A0A844YDL0_9SPHN|nr:DUF2339 domain-containing protein [Qipengyuania oceanensis]MXO62610.1 DUF2339 domain-containing protein [Qipengyuania oceanensis]